MFPPIRQPRKITKTAYFPAPAKFISTTKMVCPVPAVISKRLVKLEKPGEAPTLKYNQDTRFSYFYLANSVRPGIVQCIRFLQCKRPSQGNLHRPWMVSTSVSQMAFKTLAVILGILIQKNLMNHRNLLK
jgi:hypothetical protein